MSDSATRASSDEDWDDLLRQLRTHSQAQPRPFFYGRVQARLATEAATGPQLPVWLRWPTSAALLGALVLSLSGDCSALRPATGAAAGAIHSSYQPVPESQP